GYVRECAAEWFELGTNQNAGAARIVDLGEADVGDRLPHVECRAHLFTESIPVEVGRLENSVDRANRATVDRVRRVRSGAHEGVGHVRGLRLALPCWPDDVLAVELQETEPEQTLRVDGCEGGD